MYKRIIAMVLCICLCVAVLTTTAAAHPESAAIKQTIMDDYVNILKYTNMNSLSGYCGLMASWQLYFLGVNDWVVSYHGNNQFDAYREAAVTSGGHKVEAYDARDYSLEEALMAVSHNGTRDVYNILVGFQWTNTALGSIYGHSMVIYAILDGQVYFTEGFGTTMGRAGTPWTLSIEEFAAFYENWCTFEGIIHFGKKGYIANCTDYAANLIVEVQSDTALYTLPCIGEEGSEKICTVNRGQRLWANALYENPKGELYYQVSDSGQAGYLPAKSTAAFQFLFEDIGVSNVKLPPEDITGRISAEYSDISGVYVTLTDEGGNTLFDHALAKLSGVYDLESDTFSAVVDLDDLKDGGYVYEVHAQGQSCYAENGQVKIKTQALCLLQQPFQVGEGKIPALTEKEEETPDGWVRKNGTWYYYEKGQPRTGWFCYHGGDYYLKADGSVTTGWAIIKGQRRYFSPLGCMRTGWLFTDQGTMYLMFNGVPATGERTIDGKTYTFDGEGYLQSESLPLHKGAFDE